MNTTEIINSACAEAGVTKAELAKRMGMLPSSLYRKLSRESMTFEELQKCLDVLGGTIEFKLVFPEGGICSSQSQHEKLLERADLLETELEAAQKAAQYHRKSLRELRKELSSAVGLAELGKKHGTKAAEYLEKIQNVLSNLGKTIDYTLGEPLPEEEITVPVQDVESLAGKRVLLVEDNPLNREVVKEILMDCGLLVEEAGNGKEAVAALCTNVPGYSARLLKSLVTFG